MGSFIFILTYLIVLLTHVLLSSFSHSNDGLVLAGLANGKIALYPVSEILQVRDSIVLYPVSEILQVKDSTAWSPVLEILQR